MAIAVLLGCLRAAGRLEMTIGNCDRLAIGILLASISLAATDTGQRGIVPEDVIQARPPAIAAAKVKAKPKYKALDPQVVASLRHPSTASELGVTIWRL